jgi:PEP-CTERM motif
MMPRQLAGMAALAIAFSPFAAHAGGDSLIVTKQAFSLSSYVTDSTYWQMVTGGGYATPMNLDYSAVTRKSVNPTILGSSDQSFDISVEASNRYHMQASASAQTAMTPQGFTITGQSSNTIEQLVSPLPGHLYLANSSAGSVKVNFKLPQSTALQFSDFEHAGKLNTLSLKALNGPANLSAKIQGCPSGIANCSAEGLSSIDMAGTTWLAAGNYEMVLYFGSGVSYDVLHAAGSDYDPGARRLISYPASTTPLKSQVLSTYFQFRVTAVPEPSTWALMALGLAGVTGVASARRRQRQIPPAMH